MRDPIVPHFLDRWYLEILNWLTQCQISSPYVAQKLSLVANFRSRRITTPTQSQMSESIISTESENAKINHIVRFFLTRMPPSSWSQTCDKGSQITSEEEAIEKRLSRHSDRHSNTHSNVALFVEQR
jgi:hypothetical protein